MSIEETDWVWDRSGILVSGESGSGPLAAVLRARRFPGVRFGPFRDDDVPLALCVALGLLISFIAYLMYF